MVLTQAEWQAACRWKRLVCLGAAQLVRVQAPCRLCQVPGEQGQAESWGPGCQSLAVQLALVQARCANGGVLTAREPWQAALWLVGR